MGTQCVHYTEWTLWMATSRHGFKETLFAILLWKKGSESFFQRSIANKVLVEYVTNICEVYIDNVLIHGDSDQAFLSNMRNVLERLRSKKVTANPKTTSLGLDQVEYVDHFNFRERVSFTPQKRKKILDFPLPITQKPSYISLDSSINSETMFRIWLRQCIFCEH